MHTSPYKPFVHSFHLSIREHNIHVATHYHLRLLLLLLHWGYNWRHHWSTGGVGVDYHHRCHSDNSHEVGGADVISAYSLLPPSGVQEVWLLNQRHPTIWMRSKSQHCTSHDTPHGTSHDTSHDTSHENHMNVHIGN